MAEATPQFTAGPIKLLQTSQVTYFDTILREFGTITMTKHFLIYCIGNGMTELLILLCTYPRSTASPKIISILI